MKSVEELIALHHRHELRVAARCSRMRTRLRKAMVQEKQGGVAEVRTSEDCEALYDLLRAIQDEINFLNCPAPPPQGEPL